MDILSELRKLSQEYKGLNYQELAERWKGILSVAKSEEPALTTFQLEYNRVCLENPGFAKQLIDALRWVIKNRKEWS